MTAPLRILLVEDNVADAELILRELKRAELVCVTKRVMTAVEFSAVLREFLPDLVLADFRLPAFGGLQALRILQHERPAVPLIIVTGTLDEETAAECIKLGATDYLLKDRLVRLGPAVRAALALKLSREEQASAEEALRRSEASLAKAQEIAHLGNWELNLSDLDDLDRNPLWWSDEVYRIFGHPPRAFPASNEAFFRAAHPDDVPRIREAIAHTLRDGVPYSIEHRILLPDGSERTVLEQSILIRDETNRPVRLVGTVLDVTERKRAGELQAATFRIAQAALAAPTLQQLLPAIHAIIQELMPAANFYVALCDDANRMISFPYFVDEVDRTFNPKPFGKGLTEFVIRTGEPLLATSEVYREMERRGEVELIGAPSLDWVGVPLKLGEKTIGVLAAQTYTEGVRYGARERDILQFVSTQVAQAIERKHAEDQLKESETKYRVLFESNPEAMWAYDSKTLRCLAVNDAAVARYGWSREEFLQMTIRDIHPAAEQDKLDALLALPPEQATVHRGLRHCRKDGSLIDVEILAHSVTLAGRPARLVLAKDVTERLRLEEQLRRAQKMEAVGRLAGGVAHDFNNILTAIIGSAELLIEDLPEGHEHRVDAEEIRRAAGRAADLTRQLLAFSRQQVLAPKVLDLNAIVRSVERMLRRLIGENIELRTALAGDLGAVRADPSQLEQVILNLAVNARDAMPHGGKLTIETANVELDEQYARDHVTAGPGAHVLLAVSDTGSGMDEATRAHLFEPFFTTKEIGRGTGLGLATVYGVVKQSGGHIWVYSEPDHGATFKIYLPRVAEAPEPLAAAEPGGVRAAARGSETILLVEDEQIVRSLARRVLTQQGYTVLEAPAGAEALAVSDAHAGEIHLLLTDVVMPGIGGRELARQLAERRPRARVLYLSGYSDDAIVRHGLLDPGTFFLQKPFTPQALTRKVRQVLDAGR